MFNEQHNKATIEETIAPLLKRAVMFLEDGDWIHADEYCEKVLDVDPENAQAYLGKLMAELHVNKQEQLMDCTEPFDESNNYQKVMRFADETLKTTLQSYADYVRTCAENARVEGLYQKAVSTLESAKTEKQCKDAAAIFQSIIGYKDADEKISMCLQKSEKVQAENAIQKKKRTKKITIVLSVLAAVVVIITVICSIIGANMRADMREKFIGASLYYDDTRHTKIIDYINGDYYLSFVTKYHVEIIDENYCKITYLDEYKNENEPSKNRRIEEVYENVPYKISGGIFGLKFNWTGPHDSDKPFKITISEDGREAELNTSDFHGSSASFSGYLK